MPREVKAPEPPRKPPSHQDERFDTRIDPELLRQAKDKARGRGWSLGAVIRALLRLWVSEDVIDANDVGQETTRAPRRQRRPPKAK
jgi:hypothetical protein